MSCFHVFCKLGTFFMFLAVHELKSFFVPANNIIRTRIIKNHDIWSTLINCFISFLSVSLFGFLLKGSSWGEEGETEEEEGELTWNRQDRIWFLQLDWKITNQVFFLRESMVTQSSYNPHQQSSGWKKCAQILRFLFFLFSFPQNSRVRRVERRASRRKFVSFHFSFVPIFFYCNKQKL